MPSHDGAVCYERHSNADAVMIILNFNKKKTTFPVPADRKLKKIFDSASQQWGGPASFNPGDFKPGQAIDLYPQSVSIFEHY